MGPAPGHTLCPCMELAREAERNLYNLHCVPVDTIAPPMIPTHWERVAAPQGCICPPTSERTCQAPLCPRRGFTVTAASTTSPESLSS